MLQAPLLSLTKLPTPTLEQAWRALTALPAKTRVDNPHIDDPALLHALSPLLGQQAWVLASILEAVLAERGEFTQVSAAPAAPASTPAPAIQFSYQVGPHVPELVWSGPTGRRSCARQTRYVIEDLFSGASQHVLIAGYSFDAATDLFAPLFRRAEALTAAGAPLPSVTVILDCSRTKVSADATALAKDVASAFLRQCWHSSVLIPTLQYYRPSATRNAAEYAMFSMHAKCIIVDRQIALVGSANFSNRGRDRNLEVGALIRDHHFVQSLLAAWHDVADELAPIDDCEPG